MRAPPSVVVMLALLAASNGAFSQGVFSQDAAGEAKRENVNIEGKLEDYGGGLLKIQDATGETYLVKLERSARAVSVTGKAEAGFLARGMMVRFQARFDKRGEATEPLRALEIFTPGDGEKAGIVADQPTASLASGIFSELPEAGVKPKKPAAPLPPTYRVIGVVNSFKNGKLLVAAGGLSVKAKLSPDARISVDVADGSWARKGDAVRIEGWRYPQNKTQIVARRVVIDAAEPFAGAKVKPRTAKPGVTKEAAKGDAPAEAAKPASEEKP